jgi:hypothetical protein
MAQADQTVQNNTFPTVRADINNNLAALFSKNSGSTAPATTVAYMDWIDTSGANPVWKKRNAANNAWITLGTISGSTIAFEGTLPSQSGQSGKYLTTDGTAASWAAVTSGGQLLRAPQILTSGTSYTTPANCTSIYVECVGGGGGGGFGSASATGAGSGGGSGAYCAKYFTVTPSTSYTYAIGSGGAAVTAGGNTTFTVGATTITAGGGGGGGTNALGGAGGSATNGDLNVTGGAGGSTRLGSDLGGVAGSSFFGGAGRGSTTGVGTAGAAGGGGGGGGRPGSGTTSGGAGGAGLIRIWEYS